MCCSGVVDVVTAVVTPADGVRVARAGRRDHVHVAGKLRLAFALDLSWKAC